MSRSGYMSDSGSDFVRVTSVRRSTRVDRVPDSHPGDVATGAAWGAGTAGTRGQQREWGQMRNMHQLELPPFARGARGASNGLFNCIITFVSQSMLAINVFHC